MNRDAIPTYRPRPRSTYIDTRQSDPWGVVIMCMVVAVFVVGDLTDDRSWILAAVDAVRGWLP